MRTKTFYIFALFFTAFSSSCFSDEISASSYLKDRLEASDKRYPSFKLALELLEERNAQTLVETGTARYGNEEFEGDGGSTIIFGDWATRHDATLFSVDKSSEAIESAKQVTKKCGDHVEFACSDSLEYLDKFDRSIDFIYLDSCEYDSNQPLTSQDHHMKEIIAAYPALHKNSVVMIDDCDLPNGGQGKLAIDYLLDNHWKILHQGYQTILIQE